MQSGMACANGDFMSATISKGNHPHGRRNLPAFLPRTLHWLAWRFGHAMRRAHAIRRPRILTYHAIGPGDTPEALFDWQLRLLRDQFEVLPLAELVERIAANRQNGNEFAITFDDGVRNHASRAYPLLAAHRVPATFFVCPGLIDSGLWIWNMELRLRLRLLDDAERMRIARSAGAADAGVEALIQHAKRLGMAERSQLETQVRSRTREFEPSADQVERNAPMTWEQARAMDPRIVTIGSHSITHPILTNLPAAARRREIAESRQLIEQRIGVAPDFFCYPNGGLDASTVDLVRNTYRGAVTTRIGFVGNHGEDLHLLPRIHAGQREGLFVRRLHRPTA